jgi:hypothetical protein
VPVGNSETMDYETETHPFKDVPMGMVITKRGTRPMLATAPSG